MVLFAAPSPVALLAPSDVFLATRSSAAVFTPTSTLALALTLVTGSDLDVCDRGPRRGLTSLSTAAPLIFSLRTMVWRGGGLVVSTYCGRGFFSGGAATSSVEVTRIGY